MRQFDKSSLANQQKDGDSPIQSIVTGLHESTRRGITDGLRSFIEVDNRGALDVGGLRHGPKDPCFKDRSSVKLSQQRSSGKVWTSQRCELKSWVCSEPSSTQSTLSLSGGTLVGRVSRSGNATEPLRESLLRPFRAARLTLQNRKLCLVSRPTVTRVTFDLPVCEELTLWEELKL